MEIEVELRELRAGLPSAPAEVQARARGRLLAHLEHQRERPRPRRLLAWRRSRLPLLAAVAAVAVAAAFVVVLGVFGGSSRVESAAAEALRDTAAVAAGTGPVAAPGPGQFLYTKTEVVELQGWLPHGHFGSKSEPRYFTAHVGDPYPQAIVPTVVEKWTSPDGTIRQRETLGDVRFFSAADQRRWEAAGSPEPWSFDPRWHHTTRNRAGHLVKDFVTRKWAPDISFPDPAELPTDPKALRQAVEAGRVRPPWVLDATFVGESHEDEETIEKLFEILEKPTTTPALRAAAFGALAEMPRIRLLRDVADVTGRRGSAVAVVGDGSGLRRDFIFDPDTAELLARGETVVNPKAIERAVPAGTPFRQTAYLESGVVDSDRQTTAEATASD